MAVMSSVCWSCSSFAVGVYRLDSTRQRHPLSSLSLSFLPPRLFTLLHLRVSDSSPLERRPHLLHYKLALALPTGTRLPWSGRRIDPPCPLLLLILPHPLCGPNDYHPSYPVRLSSLPPPHLLNQSDCTLSLSSTLTFTCGPRSSWTTAMPVGNLRRSFHS